MVQEILGNYLWPVKKRAKDFSGQRKMANDHRKLQLRFHNDTLPIKIFIGVCGIGLKKKKKKKSRNNKKKKKKKKKIQKAICREFSIYDENSNKFRFKNILCSKDTAEIMKRLSTNKTTTVASAAEIAFLLNL